MTEERAPATIMIVDDVPQNLKLLGGMLREQAHRVRAFPSGPLALAAAVENPPDLILLDITMPEMTGYEVCDRLKADARTRDIPVLFISALSETEDKVRAFQSGGLDYITKPFQFEEVEARVETHLKLHRYQQSLEGMVKEQVKEIADSQMTTIIALAKLAESRDTDTGQHLERVQRYCRVLAEALADVAGYIGVVDGNFVADIENASPLHDIGKVAIPDAVLLKPGRLTPEEFAVMKQHSALGAETLEAVRSVYPRNAFINMGVGIARGHHERWDGKGYPDGLAGADIPHAARIMALADVYDALRTKRVYKEAMGHEQSRSIIVEGVGTQFDPEVVEAFLARDGAFAEICAACGEDS